MAGEWCNNVIRLSHSQNPGTLQRMTDNRATDESHKTRNGADALLSTLTDNGVEVCFTNPGTSEMHFVAALDQQDDMRSILGLFEGVVTGAADGYGRMAEKPACTLLHLGPGLANGLANLHNARRAHTPVVNIVGEHATYHRALDAPLTSDIHGFAAPVSAWIKTIEDADDVAKAAAEAVAASQSAPGQIATLIAPADTAWNPTLLQSADPVAPILPTAVDPAALAKAAAAIRSGKKVALLLNGAAVRESGLQQISRIASAGKVLALGDTFIGRIARGAGRVDLPRLPYFAEQAIEALHGVSTLIAIGTKPPVAFFAYPSVPSHLTPEGADVIQLAGPGNDVEAALAGLVDALGVADHKPALLERGEKTRLRGELSLENIAHCVACELPDQAIVVNEAATSGFAMPEFTRTAAPHDWLDLTGGAIGMGIPAATGAAVACPDRKVLNLQADGSAMYTVQALWTQARENLDVTTVIFNNRKYAILQVEFMRVGANPGPKAMDMLDLSRPDIEFVGLAESMGVEAEKVTSIEAFQKALARGLAIDGPYLIEVIL